MLHTPLMWIDKAGTFAMARGHRRGSRCLIWWSRQTHSCYLGDRTHRHDWGYGCGTCPACQLRADGLHAFIQERRMSNDRRRRIEGFVFLIAFGLTIPPPTG